MGSMDDGPFGAFPADHGVGRRRSRTPQESSVFGTTPFAFADAERIFQSFFGGNPFASGGLGGDPFPQGGKGDPFMDPFADPFLGMRAGGNVTVTKTCRGADGTVHSSTTTFHRDSSGTTKQRRSCGTTRDGRHVQLPTQAQRGSMLPPQRPPQHPFQSHMGVPVQVHRARGPISSFSAQEDADLREALRRSREEANIADVPHEVDEEELAIREAIRASLRVK